MHHAVSRLSRPLASLLLAALCLRAAERELPLANPGFERGLEGWRAEHDFGLSQPHSEAAHRGELGLRVVKETVEHGSSLVSERFPVREDRVYEASWHGRVLSGGGAAVYLRFFDEEGRHLNPWPRYRDMLGMESRPEWRHHVFQATPPDGSREVEIWIRVFVASRGVFDFDEFRLVEKTPVREPNRPREYNLRPEETARLTAADVPGPDGRVYPDWRRAGVPGGIPDVPATVRLDVQPGQDIAEALETAARQAGEAGGGAVEVPEGEFYLDRPVLVTHDGVVIRGQGAERTRLVFRYRVPPGDILFHRLAAGDRVGRLSTVEFHANPKNLVGLQLLLNGQSIHRRSRRAHWGNTFSLRHSAGDIIRRAGAGRHVLTAVATYENGERCERAIELEFIDESFGEPVPSQLGAISFTGRGIAGPNRRLTRDAERGTRELHLETGHGLQAGERIELVAPASERWREEVGHRAPGGDQARYQVEISAVDGDRVEIAQPLRIRFPKVDASHVRRIGTVRGVGIERLTIEQAVIPAGEPGPRIGDTLWHAIEDLWINGVTFSFAWGGWIREVTIRRAGKHAVYFPNSAFCEARDCLFDDAIFKGGGGTAYVGWERTYNSLMERIETRAMRHAPNIQWSSAGNVIRDSRFHGSDGQWHAGWTVENLFENNLIVSERGGGGYGFGLYASGPSSSSHGPQGPRNVVYNNDVTSPETALYMLGGNEGWLILYNRFVAEAGRAVYGKETSFDHIIAGNVFAVRNPTDPAVYFETADCVGIELRDNRFYGVGEPLARVFGRRGDKDEWGAFENNLRLPFRPDPPRPRPAVPSIFTWQREHAAE